MLKHLLVLTSFLFILYGPVWQIAELVLAHVLVPFSQTQGFPWAIYTWGGTSAGGQVQGDKALMGRLMRGDIDLMGDLTLIDYIIN